MATPLAAGSKFRIVLSAVEVEKANSSHSGVDSPPAEIASEGILSKHGSRREWIEASLLGLGAKFVLSILPSRIFQYRSRLSMMNGLPFERDGCVELIHRCSKHSVGQRLGGLQR